MQQKEDIFLVFQEVFLGFEFELDGCYLDEIVDVMVFGEVGCMVIVLVYIYYGIDLVFIVMLCKEFQDVIWSIENGGFVFECGWLSWQCDVL